MNPVSGEANVGTSVSFTCSKNTNSNGTVTYAWKKGNTPIVGETGQTLTKNILVDADSDTYYCETTVSGLLATSTGSVFKVICKCVEIDVIFYKNYISLSFPINLL